MPRYDYKCKKCNHVFEEAYQTHSEVEETERKVKCPQCKSTKKQRQFPTGTSFKLNGKGWAKDGYK